MAHDIDPFVVQPDKELNVSGKYKLSWIENSISIGSAAQSDALIDSGTSHINSSFNERKFFYVLLIAALAISCLLGRLLYLQVLQGAILSHQAEGNRQRIIPIPSERGIIFDAHGVQLTNNIPSFSLAVIPQDLPRRSQGDDSAYERVLSTLGNIIDTDVSQIREKIDTYRYYTRDSIIVKEDIPYETALKVQIAAQDLPGIYVHRGSKRLYLHNTSEEFTTSTDILFAQQTEHIPSTLAHILGYVGKLSPEELEEYYDKGYLPSDSLGKTGIEKSYEEHLRGVYGKKRIEVDARGVEQTLIAEEEPTSGDHLRLHIDLEMQEAFEKIIQEGLNEFEKERASAIALDPRTGAIKALVSWPGYDNNDFSGGIDGNTYASYIEDERRPLFNRAIAGNFPSGSVVKPAIAAAALQEGIATANTSFLSNGGLQVSRWFFPDWQSGGHGQTNVRRAIAWSVNTYFYYVGGGYGDFVGLGIDRISEYLHKFGFAKKLGVDLPGESAGFVPSPEWKERVKKEQWYVGDTYNMSIGQGDFLTTPLQMAAMTAALANRGTLYQPHIVDARIHPDTGEEIAIEPVVLNDNFISPEHLETVRLGMLDCTTYGSCWYFRRFPFDAAGKTGTAQWSSMHDTHAWMTSFAPYENPQIVVVVLVEEGGAGGTVAEPLVGRFYDWMIATGRL